MPVRVDRSVAKRFFSRVEKTQSCWLWKGSLLSGTQHRVGKFYGRIQIDGVRYAAHRISYIIAYGSIPKGLHILHTCDNTACVNPRHLYAGTNFDNMQDRKNRGRGYRPVGELHPMTPLTEVDVIRIRSTYAVGDVSQQEIATQYDVSQVAISAIVRRKTWAHI